MFTRNKSLPQGYALWMAYFIQPMRHITQLPFGSGTSLCVHCLKVANKPESRMPATPQTSGGEVEHEVSILLHLTELKLYFKSMKDHLAQVFLELVCKYFFYISMDGYPKQRSR